MAISSDAWKIETANSPDANYRKQTKSIASGLTWEGMDDRMYALRSSPEIDIDPQSHKPELPRIWVREALQL